MPRAHRGSTLIIPYNFREIQDGQTGRRENSDWSASSEEDSPSWKDSTFLIKVVRGACRETPAAPAEGDGYLRKKSARRGNALAMGQGN
jgi:hypothetical protein